MLASLVTNRKINLIRLLILEETSEISQFLLSVDLSIHFSLPIFPIVKLAIHFMTRQINAHQS